MLTTMKLRAVRPMQRHVSSTPPRVDSEFVLTLATDCLRASEAVLTDPETQQYRWLVWVQWHALAIALAGLCSVRDTELANESWNQVEQAYARAAVNIADARSGMLWRPIEKLHKKASAFKEHVDTPSSGSDFSPPQQHQSTVIANSTLNAPQLYSSIVSHHQQPLPGAMPTSGVFNASMDLNMDPTMMSGFLGSNDLNWMDFERILEDMNMADPNLADPNMAMPNLTTANATMGDMQWPQNVPHGQDWPCPMHQNLM